MLIIEFDYIQLYIHTGQSACVIPTASNRACGHGAGGRGTWRWGRWGHGQSRAAASVLGYHQSTITLFTDKTAGLRAIYTAFNLTKQWS